MKLPIISSINQTILRNHNVLIPRLFNKIWVILANINENQQPPFYDKPYTINFIWQDEIYSGEIIKKLNTPKLDTNIYEVRMNQHPYYHRILFVMTKGKMNAFLLFTFGFTKQLNISDVKTNYYSLLSADLLKKSHSHVKGVDFQ